MQTVIFKTVLASTNFDLNGGLTPSTALKFAQKFKPLVLNKFLQNYSRRTFGLLFFANRAEPGSLKNLSFFCKRRGVPFKEHSTNLNCRFFLPGICFQIQIELRMLTPVA